MKSLYAARPRAIEFLSHLRDFAPDTRNPERTMLDIVFVALGLGWLALCVGYAALCDRL
jgi:hypothetical protein